MPLVWLWFEEQSRDTISAFIYDSLFAVSDRKSYVTYLQLIHTSNIQYTMFSSMTFPAFI